jgi:probable HAF family extracellular repeat protein
MNALFCLTLGAVLTLISVSPAQALIHAFIWKSDTGMSDLGGLVEGMDSYAFGINDNGEVVGSANVAFLTPHAFVWTEETGMVDIGTPGGAVSIAFAINSNGVVVGEGDDVSGDRVAFLWTSDGGFVTLGRPGNVTLAYDISDSNWVAGYR